MQKIFYPELSSTILHTESDVEQKFILPLLVSEKPLGLGYTSNDFRTKPDIRSLTIDKGNKERLYYPDYVVIFSGLPLVLIEAKSNKSDVAEGLREARLYANELNSKFKHGINPVQYVISTNGELTLCGNIDEDAPFLELSLEDFNACSPLYYKFSEKFQKDKIYSKSIEILRTYRANRQFVKPTTLLGGLTVQNREMPPNTFGSNISLDYQSIFNPQTEEERKEIVKNAYVGVKRHLKHVEPIDKIIRSTRPLNSDSQIPLWDSQKPTEIDKKLKEGRRLKNQLLLLVGSVGSGKSTFVDYLYDVGLSQNIINDLEWVSINLNIAPVNKSEIYLWLKENIITKLKEKHTEKEFDDLSVIRQIFSFEIGAFKKTYAPLLIENSPKYNEALASEISRLKSDTDIYLKSLIRLLCEEKLLVIVLDNADKRDLEDQLLMFEVASWLKESLKALIFLPLRDTTYDLHKKEKPLDTVIKDLIYRIEPPPLKDVIYQRLKYTLKKLSVGGKLYHYALPNGMKVEYSESEQAFYLISILRSLFQNKYYNRLISGLAGRDIRKGLEMFLEFCKSSHITEDQILKIKLNKGEYDIPNHLILRALLLGNLVYYNEQSSIIKNIFQTNYTDDLPNHFLRLAILRWGKENFTKQGPNKISGYHKVDSIVKDLLPIGFNETAIIENINFLIKNRAILTESQSEEEFRKDDLICISSGGFSYLLLLQDINYLASISEDVFYYENQIAKEIADRIASTNHYKRFTTIENAKTLIDFLEDYKTNYLIFKPEEVLNDGFYSSLIDLTECREVLRKHQSDVHYDELTEIKKLYPNGSIVTCEIVSTRDYGVFVEFGESANGFIHISQFARKNLIIEDFEIGDILEGEIIEFKPENGRFNLKIISSS